jgi:hypothetical protein
LDVVSVRAGYFLDFSKLSECITASKVLKKVILDGLALTTGSGQTNRIAELKRVVEACKKKKTVELWKENFTVNGKVDLNVDVVGSFSCCDLWPTTYSSHRCYRQRRLVWHDSA